MCKEPDYRGGGEPDDDEVRPSGRVEIGAIGLTGAAVVAAVAREALRQLGLDPVSATVFGVGITVIPVSTWAKWRRYRSYFDTAADAVGGLPSTWYRGRESALTCLVSGLTAVNAVAAAVSPTPASLTGLLFGLMGTGSMMLSDATLTVEERGAGADETTKG